MKHRRTSARLTLASLGCLALAISAASCGESDDSDDRDADSGEAGAGDDGGTSGRGGSSNAAQGGTNASGSGSGGKAGKAGASGNGGTAGKAGAGGSGAGGSSAGGLAGESTNGGETAVAGDAGETGEGGANTAGAAGAGATGGCDEVTPGCGEPSYTSCLALKNAQPSLASGVFELDPDGAGGEAPFSAYCDLGTDGGGWTRIARLAAGTRSIASIYRVGAFFERAWEQGTTDHTLSSNADLVLDGQVYGMLDARPLFGAATALRFSCNDTTRSKSLDAIWSLDSETLTSFLESMTYSSTSFQVRVATNGGGYANTAAYPTNTIDTYYGNSHICGADPQSPDGFQLGLCGTGPTVVDYALTDLDQVALGYHPGYEGLRLECGSDTADVIPIEGEFQVWVK